LYDGINSGRITLAGLTLPRAADDRLVLAVDGSPWPRPDAATSAMSVDAVKAKHR
jgi:hypothetical protein